MIEPHIEKLQIILNIVNVLVLIWTAWLLRKYTKETQEIRLETRESNRLTSQQTEYINRTNAADFIVKFKSEIFTKEALSIVEHIVKQKVSYNEETDSFEMKVDRAIMGAPFEDIEETISAYKMDMIIGHFEDLGVLFKREVVPIDLIYEFFDDYICLFWENTEIQKYINSENEKPNNYKIYSHFKLIYEECRKYEQSLKDENRD